MRMNCEKCKNKKATLFYADEDGTKHALCASCGAIQGRLASFSANSAAAEGDLVYIPDPTLLTLCSHSLLFATDLSADGKGACKGCGSTLSELKTIGRLACPECYAAFAEILFPSPRLDEGSDLIKMPFARRERLDKRHAINKAKAELKSAINSENFELAAALRDKIKRLEGKAV